MSGLLQGKSILITRPVKQAQDLVDKLHAHGAETIELPLIRICPPDSWAEFDAAFAALENYSWLIFASANAVESSLQRARELGCLDKLRATHSEVRQGPIAEPASDGCRTERVAPTVIRPVRIACIGKSTAASLADYGLKADHIPESFVAESLVKSLGAPSADPKSLGAQASSLLRTQAPDQPIKALWPKTNIGRLTIKEELEKFGWQVDIVHSYSTRGPENPDEAAREIAALLQSGNIGVITLTSSETAKQLHEILQTAETKFGLSGGIPSSVKLAVIGPETAKTCQHLFERVDIQAVEYSVAGLVDAIVQSFDTADP